MSGSIRLAQNAAREAKLPWADLPTFLCPGILSIASWPSRWCHSQTRTSTPTSQRRYTTLSASNVRRSLPVDLISLLGRLPQQCPGCGALSQTVDDHQPGFYTPKRKAVRSYLVGRSSQKISEEDRIVSAALQKAGSVVDSRNLGDFSTPVKNFEKPVCDRCNNLKNHETGVSIHHPSMQSIQDTILESPYKYNHIYHVLDAADFPMSLVPGLYKLLSLTPLRSLNRRSKTGRFYHGKKTEVSFIITRSDLLAPLKTQVDSMMPYLRTVLRDALGRAGKDARLGNVRCVSAHQGWWTKELKEEIWTRGGGGWMVGKVNVGKSQLFHDVFPKGRRERDKLLGKGVPTTAAAALEEIQSLTRERNVCSVLDAPPETTDSEALGENEHTLHAKTVAESEIGNRMGDLGSAAVTPLEKGIEGLEEMEENSEFTSAGSYDSSSLLPPIPAEVDYPSMPLVSSLPGTTASPIRLSFGGGKGELIDLPGLSRGDLELHLKPEHRQDLVMRSRVRPEQQVIKPGKSLLLGGFIRITPTTPDVIILAYAFTPIQPHLTSTEKAIGIQTQIRESSVLNISEPGTGEKIKSAGIFHLKWDVTRQRTGPVTAPEAAGIRVEKLPYRVLATDILIEGCGWVELVAQVRKKPGEMAQNDLERVKEGEGEKQDDDGWDFETKPEDEAIDDSWPAVEVFSPEGKYIASRRPMNAWLLVANKPTKGKMHSRPRKSMKGVKKTQKRGRIGAPL